MVQGEVRILRGHRIGESSPVGSEQPDRDDDLPREDEVEPQRFDVRRDRELALDRCEPLAFGVQAVAT